MRLCPPLALWRLMFAVGVPIVEGGLFVWVSSHRWFGLGDITYSGAVHIHESLWVRLERSRLATGSGGPDALNCIKEPICLVSAHYIFVLSTGSFGDPTAVRGTYDNSILRTTQILWCMESLSMRFVMSLDVLRALRIGMLTLGGGMGSRRCGPLLRPAVTTFPPLGLWLI